MGNREIPYTPVGLAASFSRSRNFRARFSTSLESLKPELETACEHLLYGEYTFSDLTRTRVSGRTFYKVTSPVDDLVLMHCFNNLRRSLDIHYPDRHRITRQLSVLFREETPFQFIKLDVSNFYESIPVEHALSILEESEHVSPITKMIVRSLFKRTNLRSCVHLPLGLGLSSVLSEIYMQSFDAAVRRNHSFYYYARYVDDIACFSSALDDVPVMFLRTLLGEHRLSANAEKERVFLRDCHKRPRCKRHCTCNVNWHTIPFLGYSFTVADRPNPQGVSDPLQIDIAESKTKRQKTRLVRSIVDFHRTNDFALLLDRIRFLTANYWIRSQVTRSNLRAGFYFNYPLLKENSAALRSLDVFLRTKIRSMSGPVRTRLAGHITPSQEHALGKYSFLSAYAHRITYWFTEKRLTQIQDCWKNE